MPSVKLILGPVLFQDFEVPASINLGGKQLLAVHQLMNGKRVIDAMGPVDADITFAGTFSGPSAASRARLLDCMRNTGSLLSLMWDEFLYRVVIGQFEAEYQNPLWIPYRISCAIVRDEAAEMVSAPASLANVVASDISLAASQCSSYDIDISDASTALLNSDATTFGTSDYMATKASLITAQSEIQQYMAVSQAALRSPVFSNTYSAGESVEQFLSLSQAAQQLAQLVIANGYLGRAVRNLLSAST